MNREHQSFPKLIYLADDDEDDRSLFAEALQEIDKSVKLIEAEDGEKLFLKLCAPQSPLPDVIILDINMPKLNGFECLEKIRSHESDLKYISIIMFSTSDNPVTIGKAKKLGATYYAVKPTSYQGMKSLISDILKVDCLSPRNNNKFRIGNRRNAITRSNFK